MENIKDKLDRIKNALGNDKENLLSYTSDQLTKWIKIQDTIA